jgi:hypothetical protein
VEADGTTVPIITGLIKPEYMKFNPVNCDLLIVCNEGPSLIWLGSDLSRPGTGSLPFISTLAEVFEAVRLKAQKCGAKSPRAEPEALRRLDHRARVVLGLLAQKETITGPEVAEELGLSECMARNLLKNWVEDGWVEITNPSRSARAYSLKALYRQYIGSLSAMPQGEEKNDW